MRQKYLFLVWLSCTWLLALFINYVPGGGGGGVKQNPPLYTRTCPESIYGRSQIKGIKKLLFEIKGVTGSGSRDDQYGPTSAQRRTGGKILLLNNIFIIISGKAGHPKWL